MDWTLHVDDDRDRDADIAALLERAHAGLGGPPPSGTRFLFDAAEMLRATRLIEAEAAAAPSRLHVGFQTAGKLDGEHAVYRDLVGGGCTVHGFGVGRPHDDAGVRWHEVDAAPLALENQWFLILEGAAPTAFVGYETSPADVRGVGGALDDAKVWAGFVSDDPRLVDSLVNHLTEVADAVRPAADARPAPADDAPLYLVATDDTGAGGPTREEGLQLAARDGARVLLYDRSAESRLTDPYDIGPWGADRDGVGPDTALEPDVLEGLGRRYLADQLRLARARGLDVRAHLPSGTGAAALADACARYAPDLLVLPASMDRPGLLDRITRNTLADLDAGVPVRLVEAVGADRRARTRTP
jgi:hypothetical protein